MPRRRQGWLLAGPCALLGVCAAGLGCHSTSSNHVSSKSPSVYTAKGSGPTKSGTPTKTLAPNSVVAWSIAAGEGQSKPIMTGKDTITPDGTLGLGPYGTIAVAGMTVAQARKTAAASDVHPASGTSYTHPLACHGHQQGGDQHAITSRHSVGGRLRADVRGR